MNSLSSLRHCAVFLAVCVGIYILHWAKDILMPLALAIILADLLGPVVHWLVSKRLPNALAVALVTASAAAVVVIGIFLISTEIVDLTRQLPNYRTNITNKIRSIRTSDSGAFGKLAAMVHEITNELNNAPLPTSAADGSAPASPTTQPIPVRVVGTKTETVTMATGILQPILSPLVDAGIVMIYLFFLLLNRDVIGHRLRWLMRRGNIGISQTVVDDASRRVTRYLRTQLLVNTCYGILIFIVLRSFGMPNSILLAIIAAALRYVPYIGPIVALSLPFILGVAVFPTWLKAFILLGCTTSVEAITGGILEPLLYGSSTGVSSIGVVLTTFFWGWVWGPVGLVLAMPLTVWTVIVGRYVPGFRSLAILLSAETIAAIENEDDHRKPVVAPKMPDWAE